MVVTTLPGPPIASISSWMSSSEVLVLLKTRHSLAAATIEAIRDAHPYELPAVLIVPVTGGLAGYLNWLQRETAQEA